MLKIRIMADNTCLICLFFHIMFTVQPAVCCCSVIVGTILQFHINIQNFIRNLETDSSAICSFEASECL